MGLTKIDDRGLKTPIDLLDNENIRLGTGNDTRLYHNGADLYIDNDTGGTWIGLDSGATFGVGTGPASSPQALKAVIGAQVELMHNGTKKLETNASAVNVINSANSWSTISRAANGYFGWAFNEGNTTYGYLGITGGGSEIGQHVGAGNELVLRTESNFHLYKGYNHRLLETDSNAAVKLYFGGTKTFETILNGASMGSGTFRLLWPNVGNANSRSFGFIGEDGAYGKFELNCSNGQDTTLDETCIRAYSGGPVELFHADTKMFETAAGGVTVTDDDTSVQVKLVSSSGTTGYLYGSGTNSIGLLDSGGDWAIKHENDDSTKFYVQTNLKATIDADGLKFGSDTAAANALHDYEEGTFDAINNYNTVWYSNENKCSYTKIGRQVTCSGQIRQYSGSGDIKMSLPFATANGDESEFAGSGSLQAYGQSVVSASDGDGIAVQIHQNQSYVHFIEYQDNAAWAVLQTDAGAWLRFTFTYFAAT